jgi:Protein of unknown function (DUF3089)
MTTRGAGRRRRLMVVAVAVAALAAACSSGDDGGDEGATDGTASGDGTATTAEAAPLPAAYEDYSSELYADDANWLCKPGMADDVCAADLDTTVVNADGSTEVVAHEVAEDPPIDCFYVYPTVSFDEEINSDLEPGENEEVVTVLNQAARLNSTCRVFAPIYRQITLGGIGGGAETPEGVDPRAVAYGDVVDAFRQYVANESDGRGFVLIGHSQGSGHLTALIADEIDGEPALQDRLVGAYLLGSGVAVPEGELVGGSFQEVPLCQATDEVGCVVTFASFRSTSPPPENSLFGRPRDGEGEAGCVNPASPSGGSAMLSPYFSVDQPEGSLIGGTASAAAFADEAQASEITTPWVTFPDFIEGECVREDGFHYLRLTVLGDPDDPRADDIGGDLDASWGMHLVDANVAMGDIEAMVAAQAEAYTGGG